jgi:hypothetical protein
MLRLTKFSILSVAAVTAFGVGMGGLNLYTYSRFTNEIPVASVAFEKTGSQEFVVRWVPVTGERETFVLRGDEWQLDVRMIKWTDWLTFIGEDPLYRLDRISGRYRDVDQARRQAPVIVDLAVEEGIDVWSFARRAGDWLPGIDASYGTSVYLPMVDGIAYQVAMTRTGLIARRTSRE